MVNKPIHIHGSFIGHVYTKKMFMVEPSINATVYNIHFSDHDEIRI